MKLTDCKKSEQDATKKYIFDLNGQEVEFSYINKNDGKDIIVCPCQTSCKMGCTFCFLTGMNLPVVNLTSEDIFQGIETVVKEAGLPTTNTLLLSFMGSGEPLLNYRNILKACRESLRELDPTYTTIRFAVATMIPSASLMRNFTQVAKHLPIKLHLSLHSPFDGIRSKMMPQAVDVLPSLELLRDYKEVTKNPIEIHYTLIDGFNDREEDQEEIISLFKKAGILEATIKFLDFKARPDSEIQGSSRVDDFMDALEDAGVPTEFYAPPGPDIGSSCGQFVRSKACSN